MYKEGQIFPIYYRLYKEEEFLNHIGIPLNMMKLRLVIKMCKSMFVIENVMHKTNHSYSGTQKRFLIYYGVKIEIFLKCIFMYLHDIKYNETNIGHSDVQKLIFN